MKRPLLLNLLVLAVVSAALLVACGDSDSSKGDSTGTVGGLEDAELENGKKLRCDESYEGAVAAMANGDFRRCVDGSWVKISRSEAMKADEILGIVKDTDNDDSDEKSSSSEDEDPKDDIYQCNDENIVEYKEDCVKLSSSSTGPDRESSSSTIEYGTFVDERDGQTYKTVKIGTQTWMAENLNYNYNEGTAESFCYKDSTKYCETYGRLYLWSAAMDSAAVFSDDGKGCGYGEYCSPSGTVRGVCPAGWHLPSYDEWEELFTAVGGWEVAGTKLKAETGWSSGGNGMDAYGFSALPADGWYGNGDFDNVGYNAYFWSSSDGNSIYAYRMNMFYNNEYAYLSYYGKSFGFSVRCLQDSNESSVNPDQESSSSETSSSSSSTVKDGSEYDPDTKTLTDLRDDQTYKTVKIGTQTWMAENLNYNYNEGTAESYVNEYHPEFGRYYTWAAAMDSAGVFSEAGKGCGDGKECEHPERVRGVCPEGWHLPSYDEWEELFTAVGGWEVAGTKLKAETGWYDGGNGTDSYGFSALPAGIRNFSGDFYDVGSLAGFWSSSEFNSLSAYRMYLYYRDEGAYLGDNYKDNGFSVRCLQD